MTKHDILQKVNDAIDSLIIKATVTKQDREKFERLQKIHKFLTAQ